MTTNLLSPGRPSAHVQLSNKEIGAGLFSRLSELLRQERSFLDPSLKMEYICQYLQINRKFLLKALKQNGFRNFPHFINHFRIEEAKKMMAQEAFDRYTLEAIAEMAGFGTRQAFYNTFERLTGVKPAKYRRNHRKDAIKASASATQRP
jgi:AraC-like DNA-binding protein